MKVTHTILETRQTLAAPRAEGLRIALVPTMGALHEGHLALVEEARRRAEVVVVSIFVNPLQFGENEDLAKYPRTLEADVAALSAKRADVVLAPGVEEMYPPNAIVRVSAAPHDAVFEGAVRPGHFTGVLTVVTKLLHIVQPHVAIFGQKDLQQLSLVRRLVRDLNAPVEIVGVPTVREIDGLAMSSRNRYLSPQARMRAARLHQALHALEQQYAAGVRAATPMLDAGREILAKDPDIAVDYFAIVDPATFRPVTTVMSGSAAIIAARVDGTRLIDNVIFS